VSAPQVQPLLIVVGPTGSGKSALALRLAQQVGGEVVSADSVQVYRHFDVGSGKLRPSEWEGIPHHGIDVFEPHDEVDASLFSDMANTWITRIRQRGRVPIVCGGTFLWIRALVHGLVPAPPKDDAIRARHQELIEREGRAALHARLVQVDPEAAQRLNVNDSVRVGRALEVHELTGQPLSGLQREHAFLTERHRPLYLGIDHGFELDARIEARVATMLAQGFVAEVERLCALGFRETRAMKSVGYRQVLSLLDLEAQPPSDVFAREIVRAMRIFARRQRTWLRGRDVVWLTPEHAAHAQLPVELRSQWLTARPG
jgi:tRNA dimethylallyltransferase